MKSKKKKNQILQTDQSKDKVLLRHRCKEPYKSLQTVQEQTWRYCWLSWQHSIWQKICRLFSFSWSQGAKCEVYLPSRPLKSPATCWASSNRLLIRSICLRFAEDLQQVFAAELSVMTAAVVRHITCEYLLSTWLWWKMNWSVEEIVYRIMGNENDHCCCSHVLWISILFE